MKKRFPKLQISLCILTIQIGLTLHETGAQFPDSDSGKYIVSKVFRRSELSPNSRVNLDVSKILIPGISAEDQLDIEIESLPSQNKVSLTMMKSIKITNSRLILGYPANPSLDSLSSDDEVRITASLKPQLRKSKETLDLIPAVVKEKISYNKASEESKLLLSPFLSTPIGGGGETALNAILYKSNPLKLNSFVNQILLHFNSDTGSRLANPSFLNLGIAFRKVIPLSRNIRDFRKTFKLSYQREVGSLLGLGPDLSADRIGAFQSFLVQNVDRISDIKPPFFSAVTFDWINPSLESSAGGIPSGSVMNFVNGSNIELRSGEAKLFGSKNLIYAVRLIPFSLESGVNIKDRDNRNRQGHSIFRLNTGASVLTKFRFPCRDDLIANRIELELKGINRHLLKDESMFNPLTERNDKFSKRNTYLLSAELTYVFGFTIPFPTKIFGFSIPKFGRNPAIVVSYKNGYLPPVYTHTNAVRFRFTLATKDDTNRDDMKLTTEDMLN